MNVFFSWSGPVSHRVAHELADWLPYVIQAMKPFVSSEHIDKGERWNEELMTYLNDTAYGVICITRHNMNAAWMNFEAGALSNALHRPEVAHALYRSNVVPFLFGVDSTDLSGPLEQFQATVYRQDETANKEEVFKLVSSMNSKLDLQQQIPQERLKRQFDKWWPELRDGG